MKKYFFVIAFGFAAAANAQNVGIGTPNPQNKLHVAGGFKLDTLSGVNGAGLLWHNANGVVYGLKYSGNVNEVLRGDGTFGPYNPAINGALGWLLTGNSATNPTTNFIGTIDDASLVFKIRNLHSGVIDSASRNSSFGYRSLSQPSPGSQNTAFGYAALLNNNGFNNVAIGVNAMEKNTNGLFNNAIGNFSLQNNIQGSENVALGYAAMFNNSTGNDNTAVGLGTLFSNTTGVENTAIGHNAQWRNTTASYNTSVGVLSLGSNTVGSYNTAIGHKALEQNINGSQNTATGYGTLQGSRGSFNSAFGYGALTISSLADHNSAFGRSALRLNTGLGNTAIGSSALENNISGTLNSAVGALAGYNLPNNVSNVTCIGYQTGWNTTLSNQVNIGNFSVTWIGGQTGWFHYSDKRIKNDIKDDVPGLTFITRLKPITYHVDIDKQEEIVNGGKITTTSELIKPVKNDLEGKYDVEKIKMTGFFAQDVEEAAKSINYSFNGVHNPKNGGLYSLDYSAFVVPLVKAVQEQQKIIDDQNKKIDKQQQQIDLLIKEMQGLKKDLITQKN